MTVSIVVPAYNAERTIARTLESVCAQTCPAWEAVVVDDGSTDRTAEVVQSFAARESRIRLVRQTNAGEAAARNAGLEHVRGEWLLFLDADDWIGETHLERLTTELARHPDLDAVHCRSLRVAADGSEFDDGYQAPAGDLFPTLAQRAAFPVHACLVRRSIVETLGGFDTSFRTSTDWDLWQRVARTGARFGAVPDVLAFYRMQPESASLHAEQLLVDGLRVLHQGHAVDPRVRHPDPRHANGSPPDEVLCQQFYLLCWCAGLTVGSGHDARPLLDHMSGECNSGLYADAVARCLFESATLPRSETPSAWERLWGQIGPFCQAFLDALETRSGTSGLAAESLQLLKKMILGRSAAWGAVIAELDDQIARLRTRGTDLERQLTAAGQRTEDLAVELASAAQQRAALESELDDTRTRSAQSTTSHAAIEAERNALLQTNAHLDEQLTAERLRRERLAQDVSALQARVEHSANQVTASERLAEQRQAALDHLSRQRWVRIGQRLGLVQPLDRSTVLPPHVAARVAMLQFHAQRARLRLDRLITGLLRPRRRRVLATACWHFPIYSQTFVYQELVQLIRSGRAVRFLYGERNDDPLPPQFRPLWRSRRRFIVHADVCRASFEHFMRVAPDRVNSLIDLLAGASGMSREEVTRHYHFGQAFAFARLAEAYRPDYLHSYFFYEGTLFTFVASHLLDIPRGVSCYADHMLQDYELKVVPLHLRDCSVIVATSERIKRELLTIEPGCDASRIVVKPNGINVMSFPTASRPGLDGSRPLQLVSVSRIEPKKGLLYLVDAVARLREQSVPVVLRLVGGIDASDASRTYSRELQDRISTLGLQDCVLVEGRKSESEINDIFSRSDLFVAPYVETNAGDKDGVPTAILEAMSAGLPIVATDAGSIREVIRHEQDGLIVPQRDPAALAEAITRLSREPQRLAQLGENAGTRVREAFEATKCERHLHERLEQLHV